MIRYVLYSILFGTLFLSFGLLFWKNQIVKKLEEMARRTRGGLEAAARQRNLAERRELSALINSRSYWYLMEQRLYYTGIKYRFKKLTAECWFVGHLVGYSLAGVLGMLLLGLPETMAIAVALGMIELLFLRKLRSVNRNRVENNLTELLDFLGNYSVTASDQSKVLYQISRYMEEPLRTALEDYYYEALTTGDSIAALVALGERIEHPQFKELVRNMDISLRYSADFGAFVSGSRRSLREYMKAGQERRTMQREATINLILLVALSFLILTIVAGMTGMTLKQLMLGSVAGRIGIILLVCLLAAFRLSCLRSR